MIVTASNLQLTGSHASLEYQRRHESLGAWRDGPNGRSQIQLESTSESLRLEASATRLTLSQEALRPPGGTNLTSLSATTRRWSSGSCSHR